MSATIAQGTADQADASLGRSSDILGASTGRSFVTVVGSGRRGTRAGSEDGGEDAAEGVISTWLTPPKKSVRRTSETGREVKRSVRTRAFE
jgi:hypothetical protein